MSAKNRAIGDTENKFQATLATYTKAGNKTAAMRRLWNAAYEIGRLAAKVAAPAVLAIEEVSTELVKEKKSKQFEEVKRIGFVEGRQAGFEDGRESAMTADVFTLSFQAGKTAGLASGRELGRETEEQRWKDAGHFPDGMCRTFNDTRIISPAPRQSFPPNTSTNIPGTFNWADDAESLPIHTLLSDVRQLRDLSDLPTPHEISRRLDEIETDTTTQFLFCSKEHQYSIWLTTNYVPKSRSRASLKGYQRGTAVGVWISGMVLDDVA
ncbi:hypothetical protein B0H19DRAFT_1267801 [Mycena capillaripes]|nr:hypothetical protein B0H19DRAFT_1267801 [Mycena capillaripes]